MRTINVTYHREAGTWWAESADVPGYTAVADSMASLRPLVADGLAFALEGEELVIVEELENGALLSPVTPLGIPTHVPEPVTSASVGVWNVAFDPWAHIARDAQPAA